MKNIKKGHYGYLQARRTKMAVFTFGLLAVVLITYFGALAYFKTNQNWFTIIAALICLPTAKFAVDLIMLFRAKGCSQKAAREIKSHVGDLPGAYDMYMTSYSKNFAISHAVVGAGCVACLTEDPACDTAEGEKHIRKMIQGNGFHGYTVKIFSSLDHYLVRLDQLNDLLVDDEKQAKAPEILELLGQISL